MNANSFFSAVPIMLGLFLANFFPVYAAEDDGDEEPSETIIVEKPVRTIPAPVRGNGRGTTFLPSQKGGKNKPDDSVQDQMKRKRCKDLLDQIAEMQKNMRAFIDGSAAYLKKGDTKMATSESIDAETTKEIRDRLIARFQAQGCGDMIPGDDLDDALRAPASLQ